MSHAPFEWQGKQACLLIEGAVWSNPYYHKSTDSVDTPGHFDFSYATNMTRGAVGYLATYAGGAETAVPEPNCLVILIAVTLTRLARRRRG